MPAEPMKPPSAASRSQLLPPLPVPMRSEAGKGEAAQDEQMRDQLVATSEMQCAYCFSTHVQMIDSYETREVIVVCCLDCGRRSELDTENQHLDTNTVNSDEGGMVRRIRTVLALGWQAEHCANVL